MFKSLPKWLAATFPTQRPNVVQAARREVQLMPELPAENYNGLPDRLGPP